MYIYSPSSVGAVEAVEAAIDYAVGLVGIKALKPFQRDAIRTFVGGRDVFVSLPTGFGKSLCYAFLPLVVDRLRCRERASIALRFPIIDSNNSTLTFVTTSVVSH